MMLTAVGLDKHFPKLAGWNTRPMTCSVALGAVIISSVFYPSKCIHLDTAGVP